MGLINGVLVKVILGTQNNLVIQDTDMGTNGSVLMVGAGNYNNFTSSVILGARSAFVAAAGTSNLVAIGRQNYENFVGGVSAGNVGIGTSAARFVLMGNNSVVIGSSAVNSATILSTSVVIGQLAGSGPDELTNCIILGRNAVGPSGAVLNYLNIGNVIQGDLNANTINIGGADNTKPTNTELSLSLDSITQVFKTNVILTAVESGLTPVDGTIHYNSDLEVYRGVEDGVVKTFVTTAAASSVEAYPSGYISWPNGPVRTNDNVITLQAPFDARDPTNTFNFEITSNITASLIVDGVGGIATAQFPATANTLYHLRVVGDSTGVNADNVDFIEAGTSPVLPAGFDRSLILYPAVYVDNGTILSTSTFTVVGNSIRMYLGLDQTDSQILPAGNDIVATLVDASEFVAVGQKQIVSLFYNYTTASNANEFAAISINQTLLNRTNRIKPGVATQTRGLIDVAVSDVATFNYLTTSASDILDLSVNYVTSSMRF